MKMAIQKGKMPAILFGFQLHKNRPLKVSVRNSATFSANQIPRSHLAPALGETVGCALI